LKNNYVTKEVLERYFRYQIINGIKSSAVFEKAIDVLRDLKGYNKDPDFISFFVAEAELRKQ